MNDNQLMVDVCARIPVRRAVFDGIESASISTLSTTERRSGTTVPTNSRAEQTALLVCSRTARHPALNGMMHVANCQGRHPFNDG